MLVPTKSGVIVGVLFVSSFVGFTSGAGESNSASIFNLPVNSDANFTFALSIPNDSTDLCMHLSGPIDYSWIAVGTGSEMKDSLMIILYSNKRGDNVTISPRLSFGEQEPTYSSTIALDVLEGTGISNKAMTANIRCSNCSSWAMGSLNLQSTSQSWTFGLGPIGGTASKLRSNSKSAGIERHSEYGSFTMDMKHATGGTGQLPSSYAVSIGSAMSNDGVTDDSNWPSILHALCACGALILLMPTGIAFLRLAPKNVRWHWINQSLSTIIAIIGIIIGFYLSTMFNKSQNYASAHQVIGIIILLAILAQWGMGVGHHLMYRRTQRPTKLGPIHRYFGYIILFLAILNGGIGLTWSYASKGVIIGYSIAVLILGGLSVALFAWSRFTFRSQYKDYSSSFELGNSQGGTELGVK